MAAPTTYTAQGPGNWSNLAVWAGSPSQYPGYPFAIIGLVNTSGTVVVTLSQTPNPAFQIGDIVEIVGVGGATECNGIFTITAVASATITFTAGASAGAYTTGGVATRGDIVNSAYDLTVDVDAWIGDNTTGYGLTTTSTAKVTMGVGKILDIKGGLSVCNEGFRYAKNCRLRLGSTAGAVSFFSGNAFSTRCIVDCVAGGNAPSQGNEAIFSKRVGAVEVRVSPYYYCDYDLAWVNYEGIGSGSFSCADPGTYAGAVAQLFRFHNCSFVDCGPHGCIGGNVTNPNGTFDVKECTFENAYSGTIAWRIAGTMTTGYRRFSDNVIKFGSGVFEGYVIPDVIFENNYLGGALSGIGWKSALPASFSGNLNRMTYAYSGLQLAGDIVDHVTICEPFVNPHGYYGSDDFPTRWLGNIWESPQQPDGDSGDFILSSAGTASQHPKIAERCIILPISTGNSADGYNQKGLPGATLHTIFGGMPNSIHKAIHNTIIASDNAGHGIISQLGESSSPSAGNLAEVSSNLIYSYGPGNTNNGTASQLAVLTPTTQVDNAMTPAMCKNNGLFNVQTVSAPGKTNDGTAYGTNTTGTVPGANDVSGEDPLFVDRRACFVKWGRTLLADLGTGVDYTGATYTDAQIIDLTYAEMEKLNEAGFDSRFTIAAYIQFVRDGFRPTNTAYRDTAADGTDIGAVEGLYAPTGSLKVALGFEAGFQNMLGGYRG